MNWIDEKVKEYDLRFQGMKERPAQEIQHILAMEFVKKALTEAHTKGTQEALDKWKKDVDDSVRNTVKPIYKPMNWIDEKQRYVAEIAMFWDEIARNLPKCVERSALGDDVIFQAVNVAYEKFRPHIKAQGAQEALAKVEEWAKVQADQNGEKYNPVLIDLIAFIKNKEV